MLRQSIRRSVRRLAHALGNQSAAVTLGETSSSSSSTDDSQSPQPVQQRTSEQRQRIVGPVQLPCAPPPDYTTVLVEMSRGNGGDVIVADPMATGSGESSATPSLSNEQSTSIECLMERAAPINVDHVVQAVLP